MGRKHVESMRRVEEDQTRRTVIEKDSKMAGKGKENVLEKRCLGLRKGYENVAGTVKEPGTEQE